MEEINKCLFNLHMPLSTYRAQHMLLSQKFQAADEFSEMKKIYHLIEMHNPVFRYKAINLSKRATEDKNHKSFPLGDEELKFPCADEDYAQRIRDIRQKVELMPSEWTLVQLTSIQPHLDIALKRNVITAPLQITVFECGQLKVAPFTICIQPPCDLSGRKIEIMKDFDDLIEEINEGYSKKRDRLKGTIMESYRDYMKRLDFTLKMNISIMQNKWLGKWRALLMGRYADKKLEVQLETRVANFLKRFKIEKLSATGRQILLYTLKGQPFLSGKETRSMLKHCFPEMRSDQIGEMVEEIAQMVHPDVSIERHPVILIVDGLIDSVPWEMLDVLANQTISRIQSFHITYALYNAHEASIVRGRKIINGNSYRGAAINNPNLDLIKLERRLGSFYSYWLPSWTVTNGTKPTEEEFIDLLSKADIFSYAGHGDGMQFIKNSSLEKLHVNAVVLLFGCRSVSLRNCKTHEPQGNSQNYVMCCCPCIVGNLWNVTDHASDILATDFLTSFLRPPSNTPHWSCYDKMKWGEGETDLKIEDLPMKNLVAKPEYESDLYKALNIAKRKATNWITHSSCIARGIPVKIEYNS